MSFSIIYIGHRFLYRVKDFLSHWYIGSFSIISHRTLNILEALDRRLALKITLRNFLRPLYQDYSLIGYVLGFFFRFWRVVIASVIYFGVIVIALLVYIAWALLPIYIISRSLSS